MMTRNQEQNVPPVVNTKEELINKSITSTSTFSSVNNSANSSTSTTPHLNINKGFDKEFDGELDRDFDKEFNIHNETEDTVIHYPNEYYNDVNAIGDFTGILEGDTKRSNINIDELVDRYVDNIIGSKNKLNNEIYLLFEEFNFDLVTDNLLSNSHNNTINFSADDRSINEDFENNMFIKLSNTPYLVLIHSIKPEILSFSINCYLRKNILKLDRTIILKLLILSISIINMKNNSKLGLKLYSKMVINRTRKLIKNLKDIENYYLRNTINASKRTTKINFLSSSIHFLISIIIKKIEQLLLNFGINLITLWKYLVLYGLDSNFEELKIIRNIIENPASCSCIWYNELSRLVKTLQYIKKILICIIINSMHLNNTNTTGDSDHERENELEAYSLIKVFWSKFGIETLKLNNSNQSRLLFETKVLGISTILDTFNTYLNNFKGELVEDEYNNDYEDESTNYYKLDVLSERNEDDRIIELNRLIEKIGFKLDLIELGINTKNEKNDDDEILNLRCDIDSLVNHYNEITGISRNMTSGKSIYKPGYRPKSKTECKSNRNSKSESKFNDDLGLKRLRMSEVLLDEFDDDNKDMTARNRRSSGINVKLFSVVKDDHGQKEGEDGEEEGGEGEIIVDDEKVNKNDNEFKKTLEKLCMDKETLGIQARLEQSTFDEFKQELKERLEKERT